MDAATLTSLHVALSASPENAELRMVLVAAHAERQEYDEAAELVSQLGDEARDGLDPKQRRLAAHALLEATDAEAAHALLGDGDEPEIRLLRARVLLALDRQADGLTEYKAAVAANAALEDPDLHDRLAVNVRTFRRPSDAGDSDGPTPLRVYTNDDATEAETTRLLHPEAERVDFSDVGGLDEVKRQVRKRIILPFEKPSLFQRFKKRVGGGILLYGPPGCGKTLLARATAGEVNASFYNVAISDVLDMWMGESEQKLHALFEKARAAAPSVLFFDEIEALGGKREYSRSGAASKLVSQFLAEMDGFAQDNSGVLVLGATNVPWAVDPAFRRPGRFDRVLFVPPPDRPARQAILGILLRDRPVAEGIDLATLAQHSSGFSGADLLNLVETAADEAIEASIEEEREVAIDDRHLRRALAEVRSTTTEWLTTARNYARYANEAGQYDEVLAFLDRHGRKKR